MRYLGAPLPAWQQYTEEDVGPATFPAPGLTLEQRLARDAAASKSSGTYTPAPGEHYDTSMDTYQRVEQQQAENQLSQELGMKTASQQAATLSQPTTGRSTPLSITSMDFATQLAGILIGGWASVAQQKELAKQLYAKKQAYVPAATARQAASFRWDFLGYAVLGFAVLGGLIYFLGRRKGSSGIAAAVSAPAPAAIASAVPALPAPSASTAKRKSKRRRRR